MNDIEVSEIQRICGKHAVRDAIKSDRGVYKLWLSKTLKPPILKEFQDLAKDYNIPVQLVPPQKLNSMLPESTNQGIIAETGDFNYTEWGDFLDQVKAQENPLVLVLDQIQDPHNLGAIIRSAESAGVLGIVLAKHGAAGISETVAKAAAGALEAMTLTQVTNISRSLEDLKELGVWVMGLDANEGENIYKTNLKGPLALVIGNEHKGLRPNVSKHCDVLLNIPTLSARSLNASVSTGVALFEALRQRSN